VTRCTDLGGVAPDFLFNQRIAAIVLAYWVERDAFPTVRVEATGLRDNRLAEIYRIRSDMMNGWPRLRS